MLLAQVPAFDGNHPWPKKIWWLSKGGHRLPPFQAMPLNSLNTVDGNKAPELFLLLLASVVELLAALLAPAPTTFSWVLGLSSSVVIAFMFVLQLYRPTWLDKAFVRLPRIGAINLGLVLSIFLLCWWGVGCGICTFQGPFTTTSNGYFACAHP